MTTSTTSTFTTSTLSQTTLTEIVTSQTPLMTAFISGTENQPQHEVPVTITIPSNTQQPLTTSIPSNVRAGNSCWIVKFSEGNSRYLLGFYIPFHEGTMVERRNSANNLGYPTKVFHQSNSEPRPERSGLCVCAAEDVEPPTIISQNYDDSYDDSLLNAFELFTADQVEIDNLGYPTQIFKQSNSEPQPARSGLCGTKRPYYAAEDVEPPTLSSQNYDYSYDDSLLNAFELFTADQVEIDNVGTQVFNQSNSEPQPGPSGLCGTKRPYYAAKNVESTMSQNYDDSYGDSLVDAFELDPADQVEIDNSDLNGIDFRDLLEEAKYNKRSYFKNTDE